MLIYFVFRALDRSRFSSSKLTLWYLVSYVGVIRCKHFHSTLSVIKEA